MWQPPAPRELAPEKADEGKCQRRKTAFPKKGQPRKEACILSLCNRGSREDWVREIREFKRNRLGVLLLGVLRKIFGLCITVLKT